MYKFGRIKRRFQSNSNDDDDSITFGIVLFKDGVCVDQRIDLKLFNRLNKYFDLFKLDSIFTGKANTEFIGISESEWEVLCKTQNGLLKMTPLKNISTLDTDKKYIDILFETFIDKYYNKSK